MGDAAKATEAFTAARLEQEKIVAARPDYGPALCVLGLIDAALGQKELALEEGRRAMELMPEEKDALNGQKMQMYFCLRPRGWVRKMSPCRCWRPMAPSRAGPSSPTTAI